MLLKKIYYLSLLSYIIAISTSLHAANDSSPMKRSQAFPNLKGLIEVLEESILEAQNEDDMGFDPEIAFFCQQGKLLSEQEIIRLKPAFNRIHKNPIICKSPKKRKYEDEDDELFDTPDNESTQDQEIYVIPPCKKHRLMKN